MDWWMNYCQYYGPFPQNYYPTQFAPPQIMLNYHQMPNSYPPNFINMPYLPHQVQNAQAKKQYVQEKNIKRIEVQPEIQKKRGQKNYEVETQKAPNSTRNIKANILKDFTKSTKKDAAQVLIAKKALNSNYQIRKFLQQLSQDLPNDGKYIRAKTMRLLVNRMDDMEFSKILRVVLRNFLKGDYINFILIKKKNKTQYLKATRQLYKIVFKKNQQQQK